MFRFMIQLGAVIVAAAAISSGPLPGTSGARAYAQDLTIAVAGPMTGSYAQYGKFMRTNAELAVEQVNAAGGINGRKVRLVVEDDAMDPKQAPVVAQRLSLDPNVLAVIGHFSSTTCLAAVPIYNRHKLVVMSPSATSPDLTGSSPYWFRGVVTDKEVVRQLATYAAEKVKPKTVAILYAQAAGAITQAEAMKEFLPKEIKVVLYEPHEIGTKDFTAVLTKVVAASPDIVFAPVYIAEGAAIVRQAREMGYKGVMMGTDAMYTPELVTLAGAASEGFLVPAFFHPSDPRPAAQTYVKSYKAKAGELPEAYGANSYDIARLFFEAIRAGGATRDGVQKHLAGVGSTSPAFDGVTGQMKFDKGHDVTKPVSVAEVRKGIFELAR